MHSSFDLQRRRLIMATGASLLPTALYACRKAVAATATDGYRTVKDMHGRTVKVPRSVKRLVCTGSGALRVASYLGALDLLVGIESSDLRYKNALPEI